VSGEAILSAENSGKPFGRWRFRPEPRCGSLQCSHRSPSWWGGACWTPPRSRPSASIFGLSVSAPMKNPGHALAHLSENVHINLSTTSTPGVAYRATATGSICLFRHISIIRKCKGAAGNKNTTLQYINWNVTTQNSVTTHIQQ